MDSGINLTAPLGDLNTWYEQGYYRNRPDTGLPPAGAVLQSQVQPDHYYQMPASYTPTTRRMWMPICPRPT
jgi:hypothetical protein